MYILNFYVPPILRDLGPILSSSGSAKYTKKVHLGQKPDMVVLKNHPPKTYCQQKKGIINSIQHLGRRK